MGGIRLLEPSIGKVPGIIDPNLWHWTKIGIHNGYNTMANSIVLYPFSLYKSPLRFSNFDLSKFFKISKGVPYDP